MGLTLEQAIARVPFLANARDRTTTPLTGGITNLNYRIDADGRSYVLRITGADSELLGIDRDVEYQANLAAGKLGIAPEVVYFIQPEGYLVTRFIPGRPIPPEEMARPQNLKRVAVKVHRFHAEAPTLKAEFNAFAAVESLTEASRRHNCRFPEDFGWLMERVHGIEATLGRRADVLRPCHNDLLNGNFLEEAGEIRILDWEYAGMGDVFFDLANFSSHHRLNEDQVRVLLEAYFGRVTPRDFAHLKMMWAMSELREALWGVTQTGISTLNEDFQGYADLWFGRARDALRDPHWDEWRKDLSRHG